MKKDLIEKQKSLQKDAEIVLEKLGLIDFLGKYGKPNIVGSVTLGLMTWEDIDIDLIVKETEFTDEKYFEIVKYIFSQKNVKQIILIDNREIIEKNRPKSMYIGIIYDLGGVDWKIDIRILVPNEITAGNDVEKIKSKLTTKSVENILKIKSEACKHSKYRKEISSMDVYRAVLDNGVVDLEDFKKYLQEKGVNW